jgi:hypothetical protein
MQPFFWQGCAMAEKPNSAQCVIREQIIEDPVSGLTFQFVAMPESDAPVRLRVFGEMPFGNREILFDHNGMEAGAGTALTSSCRPTWLRIVEA